AHANQLCGRVDEDLDLIALFEPLQAGRRPQITKLPASAAQIPIAQPRVPMPIAQPGVPFPRGAKLAAKGLVAIPQGGGVQVVPTRNFEVRQQRLWLQNQPLRGIAPAVLSQSEKTKP
ncbi:MAG TPA: hypothetical protein VHV08_10190, partial [Pirellulales bacterium]|nr:hypothetical protein [Pirellulales bacterium]